jgi:phosphate transport system substrate-binding protein
MTSISTKRALLAAAVIMSTGFGSASVVYAGEITGAGATFPYPVYAKWAEAYKAATNVALNYQSIGSGGGIKQIKANTVDFGASDKPLDSKELDEAGLMQWPQIMGGVVPVVNVTGIKPGDLKLDGEALANIYLGTITKWNDPAIAKLNTGLKLPDQAIAVVHRSDGSGTTFLFTSYLTNVSAKWAETVKADSAVEWPTGLGGKGNEGVANFVGQTAGSIGYVEYAYALQNKLNWVVLANKEGNFVKPEELSFKAAAANADWAHAPGMRLVLTNQPGKESWPITGASFILIHKTATDPAKMDEVLKFFAWSFANGAKLALELDYVPMPDAVAKLVMENWATQIKTAEGKPVWPVK